MIETPIRTHSTAVTSLWSAQLLGVLRPEFLVPVIFPSNSDPVLGSPDCSVAGCVRPQAAWGLCSGHASQYRAAGVKDRSAWIAKAQPTLKGHGKARACAVPDCRRGLAGNSLCTRHLRRWKADQPSERETWLDAQVVVDEGRPDCRVAECPLQAESAINRLCRPHDGRWRQRGFPPIEEFVQLCETYGLPRFDLGQLPEPM